jgi:2-phospho-L-lactate guanylyltransferase
VTRRELHAWAVVPAKSFARAKSRLAEVLGPTARAALAQRMLEHVLDVLADHEAIAGVTVVTDGDDVAAVAAARGVMCVRDRGEPPLRLAVDLGLASIPQASSRAAIVVMGDLPRVSPDDVAALVAGLRGADVVVAPDARGDGTNALALAAHATIPTAFGTGDSFRAHVEVATSRGLQVLVERRFGLALDVDTPEDLENARGIARGAATSC